MLCVGVDWEPWGVLGRLLGDGQLCSVLCSMLIEHGTFSRGILQTEH